MEEKTMPENYITTAGDKGSINISEDVIAVMVSVAVSEVEDVAGMANTAGKELAELLGLKSVSKGVKISFTEEGVTVDVIILVRYGNSVVDTAKKVQDKVCAAVESMTGMRTTVNVHVAGVSFDKQ